MASSSSLSPLERLKNTLFTVQKEIHASIASGLKVDGMIITSGDFAAEITMNPHDAMNHATIMSLPSKSETCVTLLREFKHFFEKECGAKQSYDIPPEFFPQALEAGFKAEELKNVKCLEAKSFDEVRANFAKIKQTEKTRDLSRVVRGLQIEEWLSDFNADKKDGFTFRRLTNKSLDGDKELPTKLFLFKLENADFVTPAKIKQGLYSPLAEQRKIENENVYEYVVEHKGTILGTLMLTLHDNGNKIYAADFIVHKEWQNRHLGQAIILKSAEALQTDLKRDLSTLKLAWLISGGDGESLKGEHLYTRVIPLKKVDAAISKRYGFFVFFWATGFNNIG